MLTALEKLPADRFATAAEFAAALNGRAGATGRSMSASSRRAPAPPRSCALLALVAERWRSLALGALAGAWVAGHRTAASVIFLQRTFRSEAIYNARFAPDGRTIVYSSAADTSAPELFLIRPDYPEPKPLGLTATHLLAVSSKGELAVLVRAAFLRHRLFLGTLARVPLAGGAPREVLDSVREGDWSPDGSELAIIHEVKGRDRLEFPIGTVLYEGSGYLSDPGSHPTGGTSPSPSTRFVGMTAARSRSWTARASRRRSPGTTGPSKGWRGGPGATRSCFPPTTAAGSSSVLSISMDGSGSL